MKCLICRRELKDPLSIKRKIGPICFSRLVKIKIKKLIKVKPENGQISLFDEEGKSEQNKDRLG